MESSSTTVGGSILSKVGRAREAPLYALIVIAAAVMVATVATVQMRRSGNGVNALLSAARSAEYRVIEPRLSGGFPHRPLRRTVRSALQDSFAANVRGAHARGLAHLLNGDSERATRYLERAAGDAPTDAGVLTDLAAARYEHALRADHPSELAAAFTILIRVLELNPRNAEALFIRALVLEQLHLHEDAEAAWYAYLDVDAVSAWAAEARANLRRLERRTAGPSLEEHRVNVEEKILAEWADAVLASDPVASAAALASAAQASEYLSRDGDGTARDTIELIRNARHLSSLAAAHREYAEARRLYLKARDETACAAMKAAAAALERQRAPLAARAWVYAATVSHYLGRSDESQRMLDRVEVLERGYEKERPLATGQMWWVRGLIAQARGESDDALRAYLAARPRLESAREASALAGISVVLSETYRYIGDMESAWIENLRALEWLLDPSVTYSRRQSVQNDMALLAITQGHPRLAELVAKRVGKRALDARDPLFETLALLTHARALMVRSQYDAARGELEEAAKRADTMPRNGSTMRLVADIMLARAEALTETEPAAAVRYVHDAAIGLRNLQHRSRLPRLHLISGRAWRRLENETAAEREWQAGLAEFEAQRSGLTDHRDRSTFSDAGRALFDELVALSIARGSDAEALAVVRRARMAGMTLPIPTFSPATSPTPGAMRRGAVVEYYILPSELLIWTTSEGETRFRRVPVAADELARGVERLATRVRNSSTADDCEQECGELFDLLLRPLGLRVADMWIAPDTFLHRVPFAALFDRQRRRFVAEDHSVTILLGAATPFSTKPFRSILVTVAPSSSGDLPRLESAEREAAVAARAFPAATFLRGTDATPARFLDQIGQHDAAHFAGHALLDERHPGRSQLRLSNGHLNAEQLNGRVFPRTRLVVLAGCDTARGTATTAGPLSYARAFADAGVPHVIGSLWPVDDTASATFFRHFYAALKRGDSPAVALTAAQRHALMSRRAPLHAWATYQLYASAVRMEERGEL